MLPSLTQFKAPALNSAEIARAPYFEIWLFRSRLRFKNPPPNLELKPNLSGDKIVDKRPFVNTVSKNHYLCAEEIGLCAETLYRTGWKFFPKGWFKPAFAAIHFTLTAHGVVGTDREKFPDLMNAPDAFAWITQKYRRLYQAFNEMTLVESDGNFELVFHDPERAKQQAEQRDLFIEQLNVNGLTVFKGSSEPNRVEFFVAFSAEDMLEFSFALEALQPLAPDQKAEFIERASAWVDAIMQSVELDLKSQKLTHFDPF